MYIEDSAIHWNEMGNMYTWSRDQMELRGRMESEAGSGKIQREESGRKDDGIQRVTDMWGAVT